MQHNEIYDMDKKSCFSDCSNSMSAPSPCSSQSSMSSQSSSGYSSNGTVNNMQMQSFSPRYDMNGGDINMAFITLPVQNNSLSQFVQRDNINITTDGALPGAYTSQVVILEQPTEKFRFRYKSEMHGTHGSLNGERSEKNKKTFPEVELKNFGGIGVIRCSLYQTNMDKPSPHSHQLVVRKDDMDECDPHDVYVSPEKGYIARFENMGIIHTAKKNICDALYAKKKQKLKFETGCEELSQRQEKALRDEAEREGKLMNLNQVRLCFEAFKIVDGGVWIRISEPVFSRPINNRKSALTGELKICRLSTIVGSAAGGEDLILLVEKVSKKNIQVRFYELRDDDQVWEAFGDFSDADVHHQYAIVVRTPPYKNKDIDTNVTVFIELVRKSDDERSAPLNFRYKPRDIVLSRKRRRTSYVSSSTSSPLSSSELPEPVAKGITNRQQHPLAQQQPQTISQEFNKDAQLNSLFYSDEAYQAQFDSYMVKVGRDSGELINIADPEFEYLCSVIASDGELQTDGEVPINVRERQSIPVSDKIHMKSQQPHHQAIKMFKSAISNTKIGFEKIEINIRKIFDDYTANNDSGDTIIHEIVKQGQQTDARIIFAILSKLNLTDLLSSTNNLGQTPLHLACIFDQPMFIRPLLGLKCDPNIQDAEGNTALHVAIAENLKECVDSFVAFISASGDASKVNVNLANDNGLTPLHLAIRQNNIGFVEILLTKCNASAKVASSRDGNNALHFAVQHQNKKMVKCLLDNSNVKVHDKNRSGHNAIDLAKTLGGQVKKEILDLLSPKISSSNDDVNETTDSIKDEPEDDNDSSTEEDDDKSLSSEMEEPNEEATFKRLLKDEKMCSRLGELLNVDNKWKKLGSQLKLDHMLCLWVNAEAMLRYLVAADEVSGLNILNALQAVDSKAANIATAMMKT